VTVVRYCTVSDVPIHFLMHRAGKAAVHVTTHAARRSGTSCVLKRAVTQVEISMLEY